MSLLTALGIASMAFVAAFTFNAYRKNVGHGQTPRGAIVEAWMNVGVGFALNFVANMFMLPLMTDGGSLSLERNWWGGWVFTAISILRSYGIRRWNNNRVQFVGASTNYQQ